MNLYNTYQSNLNWIMVQGIEQVENIPVQPNHRAWIMVQNEPIFALRTADSMGLVSTEYYKFEKYEPPKAEFITSAQLTEALAKLKEDLNESIISVSNKPKSAKCKTDDADA